MQLAQSAHSIKPANRLLFAGVAIAGAGLIGVNPVAPTLPNVQHRAVQLTAGEQDWSQVFTTAEDNLTTLESEAATANADLSSAVSTELTGFETQISAALTGAEPVCRTRSTADGGAATMVMSSGCSEGP